MKKVNNIFPTEIVEDVCPLPGAGETNSFPLLHPVVRIEMKWLLGFVDAVVGLELLATTFADKHMATVLLNYVLPGICLAIFSRNGWLHGPPPCLDRLEKFLPQWLHCSGKQGRMASGR